MTDIPPLLLDALKSGDVDVTKELLLKGVCDVNSNVFINGKKTTLLHIACLYGHTSLVKTLCDMGADVKAIDGNGETPPIVACQQMNTEAMLSLIDFGYGVNDVIVYRRTCTIYSLLHCACIAGNTDAVQALLCNIKFKTNFHLKSKYQGKLTPLMLAIRNDHLDIALQLIKKISDYKDLGAFNTALEGKSLYILDHACEIGDMDAVQVLLRSNKVSMYLGSISSKRPLALAIRNGHLDIALELITKFPHSQDPNAINATYNGKSLLYHACKTGNMDALQVLLNDDDFVVSKHLEYKYNSETPSLVAIRNGHLNIAFELITRFPHCQDPEAINAIYDGKSLLHYACQSDNVDGIVQALLCNKEFKVDIHLRFYDTTPLISQVTINAIHNGKSLLHYACATGNMDAVQALLCNRDFEKSMHLNSNYSSEAPLMLAIRNGHLDIALEIITNFPCYQDCSAINTTYKNKSLLHHACKTGNMDAVQALLNNRNFKAVKHVETMYLGETPLMVAARNHHESIALELISKFPDPTLLHKACRNGHFDLICAFIHSGANMNARDDDGNAPLVLALQNGRYEVALAMLNYCDTNIKDGYGRSPLHIACSSPFLSLIDYQAGINDSKKIEVVHALIKDHNADLICRDENHNTPLMIAVRQNQCKIVESLISNYGCDVGVQGPGGSTLLHISAAEGKADVLKLLIDKYGMSVSLVDEAGNTPLHVAAREGEYSIIYTLLKVYKAPVYLRNKAGLIPRDLATDYLKIKQLFKDHLTKDHTTLEAEYTAIEKLATGRYSGSHCITRLFVLGHPGAGKSSLVETLKREGFFQSFNRVSVKSVPPHTAGIIPSIYNSATYGRVQFYDFAGDPEYYTSHAAILERLFQSDIGINVCMIVLNLVESEAEIEKKLIYWYRFINHNSRVLACLPSVIAIGSHADLVTKEEFLKKSKYILNSLSKYEAKHSDYVCLDCCNPRPKEHYTLTSQN